MSCLMGKKLGGHKDRVFSGWVKGIAIPDTFIIMPLSDVKRIQSLDFGMKMGNGVRIEVVLQLQHYPTLRIYTPQHFLAELRR